MATRNPLALNQSLSLILQSGNGKEGTPYAMRVSLSRLSAYVTGALVAYALALLGTLLFFRELEINRKLQEQVLKLETERRIYQTYPLPERSLAQAPKIATKPLAAAVAPTLTVDKPAAQAMPAAETSGPEVFARINELRSECSQSECSIRLGMVTTQPGTAVGQLLLVLETEVPRIGTANPGAPIRKRFFIYPGYAAKDDLDPNTLSSIEQKAFRFSRVLQTTTVFKMGKLLRPLAINAYVFDPDKTLLQHERRTIDSEEGEP
jgi:hypothetical protein